MALLLLDLAEHYFFAKNTTPVGDDKTDLQWWPTALYYHIDPRSFKDSDADGVGDLKGMRYYRIILSTLDVNTYRCTCYVKFCISVMLYRD